MRFKYSGNCKQAMLVSIPRAKNYYTFEKNERRERWLALIMNFIGETHKKIDTNGNTVLFWLLKDIYKHYPKVFVQSAIDVGLHVVHKMTHIEAAAMWVDANVSFSAARVIISHLNAAFKHCIQVPFSQIQSLGDVSTEITPTFKEFVYRKNGDEKVGEKIKYWYYTISDLLLFDFKRLLMSGNNNLDSFGYESKAFGNGNKGVYAILGADRGGGKSRYLLRVNILDSKERKKNSNKTNYGTRTLQFCEIDCKKDVFQIQKKIAPVINECKKTIESSMLVAIKNGKNDIKCILIPKESSNIHTLIKFGILYLQYTINTIVHEEKIRISATEHMVAWIVISFFKMVVAGDLTFCQSKMNLQIK